MCHILNVGRDDKIVSTLTRIKAELPEPVSASSDGPLNQIHNQHPGKYKSLPSSNLLFDKRNFFTIRVGTYVRT